MSVLVLAEHDNTAIKSATLNTVSAATELDNQVVVLIGGHQCAGAAESAARIEGVSKVLVADAAHYAHPLAENLANLVVTLAHGYTHILAPATTSGKNVMPRVAALLDVAQISDIMSIESADTFVRPIYAGNVLATVRSLDAVKVITVRTTGFAAAPATGGTASIEAVSTAPDSGLTVFEGQEVTKSDRPELTAARIVVSGGRGMGSGDNFRILGHLADKLNAALGASRAA